MLWVALAAVAAAGRATRQQNFRLGLELIERLEGAVPGRGEAFDPGRHVAADKSAAVTSALEAWLPDAVLVGTLPEEPAKWGRVLNPAGDGTLVRLGEFDRAAWFPGALARSRAGETLVVREVTDLDGALLLTVDRGVGSAVRDLAVGDELCQVGYVQSETSPALVPAGGDADGSGQPDPVSVDGAGGETVSAGTDGPPASPASGVEDAEPAPAALGGQGPATPASEPSDYVDLVAALAERTGEPLALWRDRVRRGRVTIDGEPLEQRSRTEGLASVRRGQLDRVFLDGERV